MAYKQIICLGIKMVDQQVVRNDRFLISRTGVGNERPFWSKFANLFNALPKAVRVFITNRIDPLDKVKAEAVKTRLKSHFSSKVYPRIPGPLTTQKRDALIRKFSLISSTVYYNKTQFTFNDFSLQSYIPHFI